MTDVAFGPRLKRLGSESLIYGLSSIVGRLLSYLLQPYYAHQFNPADNGVQSVVYSFIPIISIALYLGMDVAWEGAGVEEKGVDKQGNVVVAVDPRYYRPTEVETLLGDASKARRELGWVPTVSFRELVKEMVDEDLKIAQKDALVRKHGYSVFNFHEN